MPFIMMVRNFGGNTIRTVLLGIDWAIYHLLSFLIQIIFDIAYLPADTFDQIYKGIMSKIYVILAIFMLFKVTVSLLTYLVNPDAMSDKQQGLGKLVTRILVTFVLLIASPTLFSIMMEAQGPILRTLPKLILNASTHDASGTNTLLGNKNSEDFSEQNPLANDGITISWTVLKTFVYQNPECVGEQSSAAYAEPNYKEWIKAEESSGTNQDSYPTNILTLMTDHINDPCGNDGSVYLYQYTPVISTIAGGFLCFVLIGIAVQVGARMFKLIILQALAPIPIISYIDPKSQKEGSFNNWLKMLFTTWLELFINVSIVYIIIYLVSKVIIGDSGKNFIDYVSTLPAPRGAFFMVFVIIGLFAFAKQAPKFILDIIGIKSSGGFGKALGLAASTLGIAGAGVATGIAGAKNIGQMVSDFKNADNFGQGAWGAMKGIGRGFRNVGMGLGSAISGASSAYNSDKGSMKAAIDAMNKMNKSNIGMYGDSLQNRMNALDNESKLAGGLLDYAEKKAMKSDDTVGKTKDGITGNYRSYSSAYQAAINNGAGVYKKYKDADGRIIDESKFDQYIAQGANPSDYVEAGSYFKWNNQEIDLTQAERIGQELLDANTKDYIDNNPGNDAAVTQQSEYFNKKYGKRYSKSGETSTYKKLKASKGRTAGAKFEAQNRMGNKKSK